MRRTHSSLFSVLAFGVALSSPAYAGKTKSIQQRNLPSRLQVVTTRPSSYQINDFGKDNDETLLARLVFGEAANCSKTERIAVAHTALNRGKDDLPYNGKDMRDAALKNDGKYWQYNCFNPQDKNCAKLKDPYRYDPKTFDECLEVSRGVLSGKYNDPTGGANLYYNPQTVHAPYWINSPNVKEIGYLKTQTGKSKHKFYVETKARVASKKSKSKQRN